MIILYAYINPGPFFPEPDRLKLAEFCKQHGFHPPFTATSIQGMEMIMEQNLEETFLLFTNFPPNSSYPKKRRDNPADAWLADSYERTGSYFHRWTEKYRFAGIHIITGAPDDVLTDRMINAYVPGKKVTVIRKNTWNKEAVDYENVLTTYMIETIRRYR